MSNLLVAENVRKSYDVGMVHALNGAAVEVREAEVLAIMGSSGSGKSALLHCLTGIIGVDSGEIVFYDSGVESAGAQTGVDLTKLTDNERAVLRRTKFGFVFQFSQLVPELTAAFLDNVALPLLLSGVKRAQAYVWASARRSCRFCKTTFNYTFWRTSTKSCHCANDGNQF